MRGFTVVLLLFLLSLSLKTQATVELISTDKYSTIRRDLIELSQNANTENILLAFDIDETLLVVEDCLLDSGWLRRALNCPAKLTEESVDEYVAEFQALGFATLALTARAENLLVATERELERNNLNFLGKPFESSANFEEPFTKRSKVVFKDGITYSANKNKGEVLKLLQRRLPKSFKEVIFIDDGIQNIRAMTRAWETDREVHVRIYHYTRYNEVAP